MSAAVTDDARRRRERAMRLCGLYAITPELADTAHLVARVNAALAGGATAVQYRNKFSSPGLRYRQAAALARVVAARGAVFIINDDATLAAAVDADGVHLGEDDGSVNRARECIGRDRIIGVSCYNDWSRAQAAVDAGADYIAFGSFFSSAVKPDARRADISLLVRACRLDVPIVAIGGITAGNAAGLAQAGANAVAVITDVFGSSDPASIEQSARAISAAVAIGRGTDLRSEN
jgi:thiamine-phosphate pyrophosphorylase